MAALKQSLDKQAAGRETAPLELGEDAVILPPTKHVADPLSERRWPLLMYVLLLVLMMLVTRPYGEGEIFHQTAALTRLLFLQAESTGAPRPRPTPAARVARAQGWIPTRTHTPPCKKLHTPAGGRQRQIG